MVLLTAQIPRDTTYTLKRTLTKVRKHYPHLDLKGVLPFNSDSVETRLNTPYKELGYRKLVANIFEPVEFGNDFGILLIHGGGWRSGNPSLMTPIAEQLALAGYTVVVPEYRMSLEATYPAAVVDLKDAILWMQSGEQFDSKLKDIAVIGCSAGGQLATLIGTTFPVSAIIDIDGVLAFKHPDSEEGSMAAQWLGGTYNEVPEVWEDASALSHVSNKTPPTLFLASKYPRFLAGREEYMQVLSDAGIYTEVQFLEDAPHSFWLMHPWFKPTMKYILRFLNKTLIN